MGTRSPSVVSGLCVVLGVLIVFALRAVEPAAPPASGWFFGTASSEKIRALRARAAADIDEFITAVGMHDCQNRPLSGTDLNALAHRDATFRGPYLQRVPTDPWGRDYALDANVGLIVSFGADGLAGGSGEDEDVYRFYKPPLSIVRAQYQGPWGLPTPGCRLIVVLTQPFRWARNGFDDLKRSLCLLTDPRHRADGGQRTLAELEAPRAGGRHQYALDRGVAQGGLTDPESGRLAVEQTRRTESDAQTVTATMALNFLGGATEEEPEKCGLAEAALTTGPLDPARYGPLAPKLYRRAPRPVPLYGEGDAARNLGVRLERY